MKFKLGFVLLGLISLSGCVSMSSNPTPSITQQPNQKELNLMLNTAKDNVTKAWVSEDGDTHYSLDTSNTRVNYQGVPCRDFTLVISKSFSFRWAAMAELKIGLRYLVGRTMW